MEASPVRRGAVIPRNRYLLVLAIAALMVAVVQLLHVVRLPLGSAISGASGSVLSISSLTNFMKNYGYASLFVLMTLESASVPIPSEVVLPFAGYLVFAGLMNPALALAISVIASMVGALIDYYLAYLLGRPFVVTMLKAFRVSPTSLERAEGWFARSGQWTVFAARFVPLLRSLISLPAGLFRMSIKPFLVMTMIGCLGWSAVLIYAGYAAGKLWQNVINSPTFAIDAFSAVIVVVCCGYLVYFAAGRMAR